MDSPVSRQAPSVDGPDLLAASSPLEVRFRELFDANFDYVWTSLRRLGIPERDREDLVNEVFVRVHQRLADYDTRRALRPWLFAFAARVASEYRRLARHREDLSADAEAFVATDRAPDEQAALHQRRDLVLAALEMLDLDKRTVLILHDLDECPIPEIASALAIPEGTAYSRLRAAREHFTAAVRRLQLRKVTP
jgi:RNA polymerase sigma-70 factor (ECF subfamily)